jgi:hypothetical protein
MNPLSKLLNVLPFFILIGCLYKPVEEPLTSVRLNSTTTSINLTGLTNGLVMPLYKKNTFQITVSPSGLKYYSIEVFVEDQLQFSQSSSSNYFSFELDPKNFSDGEKKIRILSKRSSGTKSLADLLGNEIVSSENSWKLLIDKTPPNQVSNSKIEIIDGKSIIKWDKPNKENFLEYNIVRTYYSKTNQESSDTLKVTDPKLSSFHDTNYVGGKVSYQIDIKGYQFYVAGIKFFFDCVPISIEFQPDRISPYFFYSKSILYNNSIEVAWYGSNFYSLRPPTSSGKIDINVKFGEFIDFNVFVKPIGKDAYNTKGNYSISRVAYLGYKTKSYFTNIYFSQQYPAYFLGSFKGERLASNCMVYKLDKETKNPIDSLNIPFNGIVMSQNGSLAYLVTSKKLLKLDLSTLDIVETIDFTSIIGSGITSYTYDSFDYYGVTNDNLFYYKASGTNSATLYIMNLTTKNILWSKKANGSNHYLSQNSQYLLHENALYDRSQTNNWSKLLGKFLLEPNSINGVVFRENNDVMLLLGSKAQIYDPSTPPSSFGYLTPKSTIAGSTYLYYDPTSNTLSGKSGFNSNNQFIEVVDATTLFPIKRVDLVLDNNTPWYTALYVNNTFFHEKGLFIPNP